MRGARSDALLPRSSDYPLLALCVDDFTRHPVEPSTRLAQVADAPPQLPGQARQKCTILSWNVVESGQRGFEPPSGFQLEEPLCFHVLFIDATPRRAQPEVRGVPRVVSAPFGHLRCRLVFLGRGAGIVCHKRRELVPDVIDHRHRELGFLGEIGLRA